MKVVAVVAAKLQIVLIFIHLYLKSRLCAKFPSLLITLGGYLTPNCRGWIQVDRWCKDLFNYVVELID